MDFTIDEQYLISVNVTREYFASKDEIDRTVERLKDITWKTIGSEDHPEFTKLRNELENLGYIATVRNCWNGDRVLKTFRLNGFKFKKNDRFCCASAMGLDFQFRKKIAI